MGFPPGYGIAVMGYVQMVILGLMGQIAVDRVSFQSYVTHSLIIQGFETLINKIIFAFRTRDYESLFIRI